MESRGISSTLLAASVAYKAHPFAVVCEEHRSHVIGMTPEPRDLRTRSRVPYSDDSFRRACRNERTRRRSAERVD